MAKKQTQQSYIPQNAMAAVLANQYQPGSFAGIPNEAVGNLFNRMDVAYEQGQTALSNMQELLAQDMADASPEDQVFLRNMHGQVTNVINEASQQNDFHNRVRQIRDLARNISGNPSYKHVKNQIKRGQEQQDLYNKLVAEHGAENVTFSGDFYGDGFRSIGENGEMYKLNGTPTVRPDYTSAMQDLYTPRLDVTQTRADVFDFVEREGFDLWLGTQAGRIHVNDMARSMFGKPFTRLSKEANFKDPTTGRMLSEEGRVVLAVKNLLKAAGESRVGKYSRSNSTKLAGGMGYLNQNTKSPTVTGEFQTTLTDDTDAADRTIPVYYTNYSDKGLEQGLMNMMAFKRDLQFVEMPGFANARRGKVNPQDVKGAHLTPAIGPTGKPIVAVGIQQAPPTFAGADKTQFSNVAGYVEMEPEEFIGFKNQYLDDFMAQIQLGGSNPEVVKMAGPILQSLHDPGLGQWMKNIEGNEEFRRYMMDENLITVPLGNGTRSGITIEREDDGRYTVRTSATNTVVKLAYDGNTKHLKGLTEGEVRNYVGRKIYNKLTQGQ